MYCDSYSISARSHPKASYTDDFDNAYSSKAHSTLSRQCMGQNVWA